MNRPEKKLANLLAYKMQLETERQKRNELQRKSTEIRKELYNQSHKVEQMRITLENMI